MSPEAAAAEQVYRQLKTDILDGRFAPTSVLNVHMIAKGIGVSISPVRDAMERLVGERILAVRAGGGFQMPQISEEGARDLYLWHSFLVRGAVGARTSLHRADELFERLDRAHADDGDAIVATTAELFYRLGEAAESIEHLLAIRGAGDRLHALRLREDRFRDRKVELRRLLGLAAAGPGAPLRTAIATYHRRRLRHVTELVRALYHWPGEA